MSERIVVPLSIDQFVQELDKEPRWYDLGIFLGVPTSELDIIGQNYRLEGIQRCLIELFKCFQSRSKPVSCVLMSIVDRFLSNDMHLKHVFKDYTTQLQKFKKLAKMKDLMRLIKEQREVHGSHEVVEIKLHSFWDKITIQRFERIARVVFLESYKLHVQIRVVNGCTCICV